MRPSTSKTSFTIIVAFLCLALMGAVLIPKLPVKLSPSQTLPRITVSFSMPSSSSRLVEMLATSKLEAMLVRIKGIRNIQSTSGNGWGNIVLEFDRHTSIESARFEASTIIRQIWHELPVGVSYPTISVSRSDQQSARPFIIYTINSVAAPIAIQSYAEKNIKPLLNEIKGINRIDISGAMPMILHLTYDSDQLKTLGITINDIQNAISQKYTTNFLGLAETSIGGENSWIRVIINSEANQQTFDPSSIVVSNRGGKFVMLNQLVSVSHQEQEPLGYYRINGLNSIYLSITAEETANQLKVSQQVAAVIERVRSLAPTNYQIITSYNATERIEKELNKIYLRSSLTIAILLIFVLTISWSARYLFLIFTSLTINLFISVIFYYLLKLEIQLYSLAGITISLSLIIDNTIIMADHLVRQRNRRAFIPLLAATLTTIGVLTIIFYLDERTRLNLQDFATVIIINLSISLAVALFFVPAMVEQLRITPNNKSSSPQKRRMRLNTRRVNIRINQIYIWLISLLSNRKWIPFISIILIFGLPVFLLPEKIEKETPIAKAYNDLFDTQKYKTSIKPFIYNTLGGTLTLFKENVKAGSSFNREQELMLVIYASMPNGTTLQQMNDLVEKMESYLSSFNRIRQFQTSISGAQKASINIFFTKESEHSSFPFELKNGIVKKAIELGGGSWSVYGLPDQGFNNDIRETAGSYRIKLLGYNYDELYAWADKLKSKLLGHLRIKDVTIGSNFSWYKDDYQEFYFDINKRNLAISNLSPQEVYNSLHPVFTRNQPAGWAYHNGTRIPIKISSKQSHTQDTWALKYINQPLGSRSYKPEYIAQISKNQEPQEIGRENQQYRLTLQYNYIGPHVRGNRVQMQEIDSMKAQLPMGYSIEANNDTWSIVRGSTKQYWLIALLIVIIFFTTAILFNSISQPLTVIFVIPISFIGVFTTFYIFDTHFDQGGFTSFILLSGITVNASIYILNEYNRLRKQRPRLSLIRCYIKAWNRKIIPILLTVASTILGFIPFMIGDLKEPFWYPLAIGTVGGLVASLLGIWLFLPLLTIGKRSMRRSVAYGKNKEDA